MGTNPKTKDDPDPTPVETVNLGEKLPFDLAEDSGLIRKEERTDERKERARETIAFMLVFGFLALFISSFLFAGTVDEAIKLVQAISSALSGMIGAVLGYYYGSSGATKPAANTQT
ncbi:hypothetical protein E2P63_03665 [Candidatus Bathyarchaeota archaeon]|nr:hypothetical protein E2P63_03665 [Candidatus Bathyarchaeota archaeon]